MLVSGTFGRLGKGLRSRSSRQRPRRGEAVIRENKKRRTLSGRNLSCSGEQENNDLPAYPPLGRAPGEMYAQQQGNAIDESDISARVSACCSCAACLCVTSSSTAFWRSPLELPRPDPAIRITFPDFLTCKISNLWPANCTTGLLHDLANQAGVIYSSYGP